MYYYLIPYKFIVGEHTANCNVILAFDRDPNDDVLETKVNEYFEDFYGEDDDGNPDCDRDGCVCLYQGGEVCVQFGLPKLIDNSKAKWLKENHIITVVKINF